jgi:hypothetical protein
VSAQVAADLRAAADVLERDGWTQGTYSRTDGCHCVAGAVYAAICCPDPCEASDAEYHRVDEALTGLARFLGRSTLAVEGVAIAWNDDPERTAAEVIAALRAAADAAEAEQ